MESTIEKIAKVIKLSIGGTVHISLCPFCNGTNVLTRHEPGTTVFCSCGKHFKLNSEIEER